jgi:hypothetical protein
MELIDEWYDGYSWNGEERQLNPLSLQNFLVDHNFDNFLGAFGRPEFPESDEHQI